MFRIFHNSRGSSTPAGYQNPRWRTVILALVLALTIGSAGQPVLAQKSGPEARVLSTRLSTSNVKEICLGEIVTVIVTPRRAVEIVASGNAVQFARRGIDITASVENKTIVSLLSESEVVGLAGQVSFDFRGEKVGTTHLIFKAVVSLVKGEVAIGSTPDKPNTAVTSIFVEVIPCSYEVTALSKFSVNYANTGGIIPARYWGVTVGAEVTPDENGQYKGEADVVWSLGLKWPIMMDTYNWAFGKVNMTGNISKSGQLVLQLIYVPTQYTHQICVPGAGCGAKGTSSLEVSPLIVTLPSTGGTVKLPQEVISPRQGLGSVMVYVIRVKGGQ